MINKIEREIQHKLDPRQTFVSDYADLDIAVEETIRNAMSARRILMALKNKEKGGEKI